MNFARLTPAVTEGSVAVLKACLNYIIQRRPNVAILENVRAFEPICANNYPGDVLWSYVQM